MTSTRGLLLFCLFAFLLVGPAFAQATPKKAADTPTTQTVGINKPATEAKASVPEPAKGETKPAVETKAEPKVEAKPVESKPVEAKAAPPKPVETKSETKPIETKPAEPKPADAKPVEVKTETPKPATKPAEPKAETKPADKKPETKPADKKPETKPADAKPAPKKNTATKPATDADEGFSLEQAQQLATKYVHIAKVEAEKLFAVLRVEGAKYAKVAHDSAERIVDKYLAAENAKLIKTNFFNVYGAIALFLAFITLSFLASKIDWVFSLNPVRAFLSAFGLGIFLTLYGLTRLVKDPATLVEKNAPGSAETFQTVSLVWFASMIALNSVAAVRGGLKNFLQMVVSTLLLVDYFGVRNHIEEHTGILPPYSLPLFVFVLLSVLSFSQLENAGEKPIVVHNIDYKVKAPSSVSDPATLIRDSPSKEGKKSKSNKKH